MDLVDSMFASQWMNFIHLHVMLFGGVELELWLSFNYITTNVALECVMSLKKGMEFKNLDYYSIILYPIKTLTRVTWAFVVHHQTKLFDVCHVYGFKILNLLIYWKCQHMILHHLDIYVTHLHDTWHLVVCKSSNICEVEP